MLQRISESYLHLTLDAERPANVGIDDLRGGEGSIASVVELYPVICKNKVYSDLLTVLIDDDMLPEITALPPAHSLRRG